MKRISLTASPFAFKVSKPGFDVDTAVGRQLLMNIAEPSLMIIAAGRVTLTAGVNLLVPWPFTLPVSPVVDIQRGAGADPSVNIVPYFNEGSGEYTRVSWVVTTTGVTFNASTTSTLSYFAATRQTL